MSNDGWGKGDDWGKPVPNSWDNIIPPAKPSFRDQLKPVDLKLGYWQEITLTIPQEDEDGYELTPLTIEAYQCGDLAVHKSANMGHWRITHIPTLTRFDQALPDKRNGQRYSKNQLLEWCVKVQGRLTNEWAALRSLTSEDYAGKLIDEKDRIIEWCRSVKIGE